MLIHLVFINRVAIGIGHPSDSVAQLVEQYTFNVWALGSSPSGITKLHDKSWSFFYARSNKQNFPQARFKSHRKAAAQAQQACLIASERRSYTSAARAFELSQMQNLNLMLQQLWLIQRTA